MVERGKRDEQRERASERKTEKETPVWEYTARRTRVSVIVIWMLIG